jgi:S-adenosylmethionine/arginine decarboxylase-like enzyme
MFVPNHLHLLVKGYMSNPPKEEAHLNEFFKSLVNKVRMVVVAGPTSVYVNEEGNEGITGTVTLATSHSSIHVWDAENPSMFQFDLYSCSCFTAEEVLVELNKWFQLESANWIMLDRNGEGFLSKGAGQWTGGGGNAVVNPKILIDTQQGNICPQCYSLIGGDGLCWKCTLKRNQ